MPWCENSKKNIEPKDKCYGKLSATVSNDGDEHVHAYDAGVFEAGQSNDWMEATREKLVGNLPSDASVCFSNSAFNFSFILSI